MFTSDDMALAIGTLRKHSASCSHPVAFIADLLRSQVSWEIELKLHVESYNSLLKRLQTILIIQCYVQYTSIAMS